MAMLWIGISIMAIGSMLFLWQKPLRISNIILMIIFPLCALSLYFVLGNSRALENYEELQALGKNLPTLQTMVSQLQSHLTKNPESAQGWYLLGKLYLDQQQFKLAAASFAKANTLHPHQSIILFNYAQALFLQQNPSLNPQIIKLLQEVHHQDPQQDAATSLLAAVYYQQQQYTQAISLWESLLPNYPPNTADGKILLKAIHMAQEKTKNTA